ncbi:MAG: aspartate kinase [Candidatus Dormibacteria bacterium]
MRPAPATKRVLKFGGTSLGSADRIRSAAQLIAGQVAETVPVVVVSAMGSTTDSLVRAANAAQLGEQEAWRELIDAIEREHLEACSGLADLGPGGEEPAAAIQIHLQAVRDLCQVAESERCLSGTQLDEISSTGELLSAAITAHTLNQLGLAACAVDAKQIIQTDGRFGRAMVAARASEHLIRGRLSPLLEDRVIPVVTGFRGATAEGRCTTLGRGGSDSTATIIGALLPADEVWIYTDVAGVMTADPRLVPTAKVIPFLSYREALELAFFGARVLHPNSMDLPRRHDVRVRILSSFEPASQGTVIGPKVESRPGVRAVVDTRDARLFTVGGVDGVAFTRVGTAVLGGLEAEGIPTLIVTQSSADNVICFAVSGEHGKRVREILRKLRDDSGVLGEIEVTSKAGIVVAVGDSMRGTPGIAAKLFGALAERNINVMAISQGSSELSVSAAVRADDVAAAVNAIHDAFELGAG